MSRIELHNINKYYGSNHVLKDVNLTIEEGEFMTLLGPSGCGKTTTLRVIAGLEKPESGAIYLDGRQVVNALEQFYEPPSKRGLNLVFQSYALWPHMTVFDNVAFGLQVARMSRSDIKKLVDNALSRMQILEFSGRYPSELSGGQQQRVAIARAIASSPKMLLLDEPLSNLDAKLRIDMRGELKRLHQEMGTTIVYVTHDQVEALTLSTRIAVFFEGRIVQVDTPMQVYQNPNSLQVASFIGNPRINIVDGKAEVEGDALHVSSPFGLHRFDLSQCSLPVQSPGSFDCKLGFRPEQIGISRKPLPEALPAQVYSEMPAGSETLVQLTVGGNSFLAKQLGIQRYGQDQMVYLIIRDELFNIYDADSGALVKESVLEEELD